MSASENRIAKIDIIRGLAIILVICGHNIGLVMNGNPYENSAGRFIHDIIYTFHVPLLFMISGYVEYIGGRGHEKTDNLLSLTIKNVTSLYIPYLFLTYLYYAERLLADRLPGIMLNGSVVLSAKEIVKRLVIPGEGASWFLLSLLIVKILFDILNKYQKDSNTKDTVILLIFFALFWLGFFNSKTKFYAQTAEFLGWGIFYDIGYLINKNRVDKISGGAKSIVSVFCVNIIAVGFVFFSRYGVDFVVKFLIGTPMFILCMLYLNGTEKKSIVQFCGRYSMTVYIIHGLGNYVCYMALSKVTNIPCLLLLLTVSLQILISYAVFWLYRHIAFLRWMMFLFYPYKFLNLNREQKGEQE